MSETITSAAPVLSDISVRITFASARGDLAARSAVNDAVSRLFDESETIGCHIIPETFNVVLERGARPGEWTARATAAIQDFGAVAK